MLTINGSTFVLIVSILGFMFSMFLYKLGTDIKANKRKEKQQTRKECFLTALKKRWICPKNKEEK